MIIVTPIQQGQSFVISEPGLQHSPKVRRVVGVCAKVLKTQSICVKLPVPQQLGAGESLEEFGFVGEFPTIWASVRD